MINTSLPTTPLPTAALGPPSRVDLAPAGALLNMMIWDPRSSTNGSMKELYPRMYYRVVYWEHSDTRVQHHHTPLCSPCQWCQSMYVFITELFNAVERLIHLHGPSQLLAS